MKIVIQRVKQAKVEVDGQVTGEVGKGLLCFVCMEQGDEDSVILKAVQKISKLRIFSDENGRMNLSCQDAGGAVLAVSQFTLSWDGRKGNRPSFDLSMEPEMANQKFEYFCQELRKEIAVETGVFGADMQVSLINDGPVTFSLSF